MDFNQIIFAGVVNDVSVNPRGVAEITVYCQHGHPDIKTVISDSSDARRVSIGNNVFVKGYVKTKETLHPGNIKKYTTIIIAEELNIL